ncbi:MAG: hypothetical protein ACE5E6_06070 [Phycisphaerae bacterium]
MPNTLDVVGYAATAAAIRFVIHRAGRVPPVLFVSLSLMVGCSEPRSPSADTRTTTDADRTAAAPDPATTPGAADTGAVANPVVIPDEHATRWLDVTGVRGDARGGWATGSFDRPRNKITIDTRDVDRFRVDTSRIPIDWDRGVILRINGANSELRRRDYAILHFALDDHGAWVVVEP